MVRKKIIWIFSFIILSTTIQAQTPQVIEEIIEEMAANSDSEIDFSSIYEELNYYFSSPLNINSATTADLEKLYVLNDIQIANLINYIEKNGKLLSIYELQLVDGFDRAAINSILPFIAIQSIDKPEKISLNKLLHGKNQLFIRTQQILEKQKGYLDSEYAGSPLKLYTRYNYNYRNRVIWGVTAEKDAGEEFFKGTQKQGFDYYSAHLQVNDLGKIKTLTLGDFQAQFGQGLTMWSGLSYSKSAHVLNVKKYAQGLRKYSSANENEFMRGVGTTIKIQNINISAFYSRKRIDANIIAIDTITGKVTEFSAFQTSGLHATINELKDENAITETILGSNISFTRKKIKTGLTIINYQYNAELNKDTKPYNQFEFQGVRNINIGLDYQAFFRKINLFGELAASLNKSIAYINGASFNVSDQISLVLLNRNYQSKYQALYGNAFSENTSNSNEIGTYIGLILNPLKNWKISAYYDTFKFPWLKYGVDMPSNGEEYLIQLDYNPNEELSMYLKYKQEAKDANAFSENSTIKKIIKSSLSKIRYHVSYHISPTVQLKNRLELTYYQKDILQKGYFLYQDIVYRPLHSKYHIAFRYSIFGNDSWDTRSYAYENDILYAFSVPTYYADGMKTYLSVKYTIKKGVDLWVRYAQTYFSDKATISSGLNEIDGNTKSEVKAQIRFVL